MKYELTSIQPEQKSKYGGTCTLLTFRRLSDHRSFNTWLASNCRNKERWNAVIKSGIGTIISNLIVKSDTLINADSVPFIEEIRKEAEVEPEKKQPYAIGKEPNVLLLAYKCPKCGGGMLKTRYNQEFGKGSVDLIQCVQCGYQL